MNKTIYCNEEDKKGFHVFFADLPDRYKIVIKRVRNGQTIGGALYHETTPKTEPFYDYFNFVVESIESNKQVLENLHFWNFGEHALKHILQHRC